jgi:hypothetical protein
VRFTEIACGQRSDEWRKARAGRLTGSRCADAFSTLKGGAETAARRDYRVQLALERIVGEPLDSTYTNADMERGVLLEPLALSAYEAQSAEMVSASGFLAHVEHSAGCSLDGYVGAFEGVVECKAPRPANHLRYLRGGTVPSDYLPQLQMALWITGAAWADFVSFCPVMPSGLELFVTRLRREDAALPEFEAKALAFLSAVDEEEAAIRGLMPAVEAL